MRRITSRYAGTCSICGQPFEAGIPIMWERGRRAQHTDCYEANSTVADAELARDNAEYQRGVVDAENYMANKRMFGERAAEVMEMEREMRFGDDY